MYVITADVKYSNDSDYIESFLKYDEYDCDWSWVERSATFFSTLEDAEVTELAVINGDAPVNEYYAGVKNVAIRGVEII